MVDTTRATGRGPARGRCARRTLRMTVWSAGVVAVLLAAAPAVAQATPEPAATYDTAGQLHNDCHEGRSGRDGSVLPAPETRRLLTTAPTRGGLRAVSRHRLGDAQGGMVRARRP